MGVMSRRWCPPSGGSRASTIGTMARLAGVNVALRKCFTNTSAETGCMAARQRTRVACCGALLSAMIVLFAPMQKLANPMCSAPRCSA